MVKGEGKRKKVGHLNSILTKTNIDKKLKKKLKKKAGSK